ncbi:hypothetical protein ACF5W4_01980 [Bacillota bacterium Lsc_1132]
MNLLRTNKQLLLVPKGACAFLMRKEATGIGYTVKVFAVNKKGSKSPVKAKKAIHSQ